MTLPLLIQMYLELSWPTLVPPDEQPQDCSKFQDVFMTKECYQKPNGSTVLTDDVKLGAL